MRVLIIDAEQGDRVFLKRVFSRFTEDVLEAETGIDGLVALERDAPDAVVLDVGLPDMSDTRLVEAIRASDHHGDVPIYCVATTTTRDQIRRLRRFNVSGLLLKPMKAETAVEKFKPFLVAAAHRQRNLDGHLRAAGAKESVILVEGDPNFREFATPILEEYFHIIGARTRAEAVQFYRNMEIKPAMIFLADDGDQLLGERDFFRLILDIEAEVRPRIFLLTSTRYDPDTERLRRYDGVVTKTFVPQAFIQGFRKVVYGETNALEAFVQVVQQDLAGELVSASQQTIGVMTGEDVTRSPEVQMQPEMTVVASVGLAPSGGAPVLTVDFVSNPDTVVRLGSKVLRREVTLDAGATDVVAELANTIGGRVRASLADRDYQLELQAPAVSLDAAPDAGGWNVCHEFEGAEGHRFVVGLRVHEIEDGVDLKGTGKPEDKVEDKPVDEPAGGPAGAGAAEPVGEASVDDALF